MLLPKFRVFLSYSHQDLELVRTLDRILRKNGFDPMWDQQFGFGQGFHEQIRNFIAHAHVFIPVLTARADQRKWVHQEIGYAMAMNVPVLPVAISSGEIEALPGEMIQNLHAVRVVLNGAEFSADDQARLEQFLSMDAIELLIERSLDPRRILFTCADFHENRAAMLAHYADEVRALGRRGLVRQKGALSSFHIPSETINHKVWRDRYGGADRGEEHCRLQRKERLALTRHAEAAGCRLIIDPFLSYDQWGEQARRVRLKCLRDFLEHMPDEKCQVAIRPTLGHGTNYTYVGSWFAAETTTAVLGKGYFQTIFTRHAPSLTERVANFDGEFEESLAEAGVAPEQSRQQVIDVITKEIEKIPAARNRRRRSIHL
jgi:hypothetical protein